MVLERSNDLAIARDLVASADVVIENFRPGVMERLGLGSLATSERHPRVIFCSLPGFADDPRVASPGGAGTNRVVSPRPDGGHSAPGSSWRHTSWASWRARARPGSDSKAREVAFPVAQPGCGARREHTGEHLRCICGKGKRRGRGVLFEAADVACAGNRHDERLLRQQPGKR